MAPLPLLDCELELELELRVADDVRDWGVRGEREEFGRLDAERFAGVDDAIPGDRDADGVRGDDVDELRLPKLNLIGAPPICEASQPVTYDVLELSL